MFSTLERKTLTAAFLGAALQSLSHTFFYRDYRKALQAMAEREAGFEDAVRDAMASWDAKRLEKKHPLYRTILDILTPFNIEPIVYQKDESHSFYNMGIVPGGRNKMAILIFGCPPAGPEGDKILKGSTGHELAHVMNHSGITDMNIVPGFGWLGRWRHYYNEYIADVEGARLVADPESVYEALKYLYYREGQYAGIFPENPFFRDHPSAARRLLFLSEVFNLGVKQDRQGFLYRNGAILPCCQPSHF